MAQEAGPLCLSPQAFTSPFTAVEDYANALQVYFFYLFRSFRSEGKDLTVLTAEDFYALRVWDRRIAISELIIPADETYEITCDINGRSYLVIITVGERDEVVRVEEVTDDGEDLDIRFFPARKTLRMPHEVTALAERITVRSEYDCTRDDEELLYDGLADFLAAAHFDQKMFPDIMGARDFFQGQDEIAFRSLPINVWAKRLHEKVIRMLFHRINEYSPYLGKELALVANAVGRTFYESRSRSEKRRAVFFYSLAHELEPDNRIYHNNWAWAMTKIPGLEDRARQELDALEKLYPDSHKVTVEKAFVTLTDVERALNDLEGRGVDLELHDYLEAEAEMAVQLGGIIDLYTQRRLGSPRGMGAAAKAHALRERLYAFGQWYLLAYDDMAATAHGYTLGIIQDAAAAFAICNRACRRSRAGKDEQSHAEDMRASIVEDTVLPGLERCWNTLFSEGWGYPDQLGVLAHAVEGMEQSIERMKPEKPLRVQFTGQLKKFAEWMQLTDEVNECARREIQKGGDAAFSDEDAFFVAVTGDVENRLFRPGISFPVAPLIRDVVRWYRLEKKIGGFELGILYALDELSGKQEITMAEIEEWLAVLEIPIEDRDLSQRNVERLAELFDVAAPFPKEETNGKEKNNKKGGKGKVRADLVAGDLLKSSVDPKEAGSYVFRMAVLYDIFYSRLLPWQSYEAVPHDAVEGLRREVDVLKEGVDSYEKKVRQYLTDAAKKMNRDERRAVKETGSAVSNTYRNLKDRIAELEIRVGKRQDRVYYIMAQAITELGEEQEALERAYGALEVDWLTNKFITLRRLFSELSALKNNRSERYMSYRDFISLRQQFLGSVREIRLFGERLRTFREVLAAIGRTRGEAPLCRSYFGPSTHLSAYLAYLDDIEPKILRSVALQGAALSALPEYTRNEYQAIVTRSRYLERLRQTVRESLTAAFDSLRPYESEAIQADREALKNKILAAIVANDITPPEGGDHRGILAEISDISKPPMSEETFQAGMSNITGKIENLTIGGNVILPVLLERWRTVLELMQRADQSVVSDEEIEEIARKQEQYREGLGRLERLNPFDPDYESSFHEIDLACDTLSDGVNDLNDRIVTRWYRVVGRQVGYLSEFVSVWFRHWIKDFIPEEEKREAETFLDDIKRILDEEASTDDSMERVRALMDDAVEALQAITQKVAEICNDRYGKESQDALQWYLLERARAMKREDLVEMYSNESVFRILGLPRWSSSSHFIGMRLYMFSNETDNPVIDTVDVPVDNPEGDPSKRRINASIRKQMAFVDGYVTADKEEYRDITLNPMLTGLTLAVSLYHCRMMLTHADDPEEVISASVDIRDVAVEMAPKKLYQDYLDYTEDEFMTGERYLTLRGKLDSLRKKKTGATGLTPDEEGYERLIEDALTELFHTRTVGWYLPEFVNEFFRQAEKLFTRIIGDNREPRTDDLVVPPEVPRFSLTFSKKGGQQIVKRYYAASPEYTGVVLDTTEAGMFVFKADRRAGARARHCAHALNQALTTYLEGLSGGNIAAEDKNQEWYGIMDTILKGVQRRNAIRVEVSEDLPANSMIVNGTIYFERDFIEFVIGTADQGRAPRIILGERLFHELGLIAYRQASQGNARDELLRDERDQLYRDVVLYERMFRENPSLRHELERYTDQPVTDGKAGTSVKFSRAFSTTDLYRRIQGWAGMVRESPERVKAEITGFVEEVFDDIVLEKGFVPFASRKERARKDGRSDETVSLESIVHHRAIASLRDEEDAVLNGLEGKDASFYSGRRHIVISSALIPECQKKLIARINKASRQAVEQGLTSDLIEIKPLSYIQKLRSTETDDYIIILEKNEAGQYRGEEAHLVFARTGEHPIFINGLVAAGRAVLYGEFASLHRILALLSDDRSLELPAVAELERLYRENRAAFSVRMPVITLPRIEALGRELDRINRQIAYCLQFA